MVDYVKHQDEDEPPQYPQQGYPPQQVYPQTQGQSGQGYVLQQYPQPQAVVVQQGNQGYPPQTNSAMAWLSCLCCFFPIGLVAVVKSYQAENCIGRGDFEGGRQNGEGARKWATAAIITHLVIIAVTGISFGIYYAVFFNKAVESISNVFDSFDYDEN